MTWQRRIIREVALALVLGGTPMIVGLRLRGMEGMNDVVHAMIPDSPLIAWYLVGVVAAALAIFAIKYSVIFTSNKLHAGLIFVFDILVESSKTFLGIYRIASGIFLTFFTVFIGFEHSAGSVSDAVSLVVYGFGFLGAACGLSRVDEILSNEHVRGRNEPCRHGLGEC